MDSLPIKEEEDFLERRGYIESMYQLEKETHIWFKSNMSCLRQLILDGDFETAEQFLEPLKSKPDFPHDDIIFELRRERYIEMVVDINEMADSVTRETTMELFNLLKSIEQYADPVTYQHLCSLMIKEDIYEDEELKDWQLYKSRYNIVKMIIPYYEKYYPESKSQNTPPDILLTHLKNLVLYRNDDYKRKYNIKPNTKCNLLLESIFPENSRNVENNNNSFNIKTDLLPMKITEIDLNKSKLISGSCKINPLQMSYKDIEEIENLLERTGVLQTADQMSKTQQDLLSTMHKVKEEYKTGERDESDITNRIEKGNLMDYSMSKLALPKFEDIELAAAINGIGSGEEAPPIIRSPSPVILSNNNNNGNIIMTEDSINEKRYVKNNAAVTHSSSSSSSSSVSRIKPPSKQTQSISNNNNNKVVNSIPYTISESKIEDDENDRIEIESPFTCIVYINQYIFLLKLDEKISIPFKYYGIKSTDMNTYKPIGIYRDNQPIRCLSYNHKGDSIAIGTNGKEIKILQNISEIPEKFDGLGNLPVMKLLYKYIFKILNLYRYHKSNVHKGSVYGIVWNSQMNYIITCSNDTDIKIFPIKYDNSLSNYVDYGEETVLSGHRSEVRDITLRDNDSTMLISSSKDKTIKLWDIETYNEIATFEGHSDVVYSCKMYDRNVVVSVSGDGTSKIWDLRTSSCTHTIQTSPNRVIFNLSINPVSQIIAFGLNESPSNLRVPVDSDGDVIVVKTSTILYDPRKNAVIKEFQCHKTSACRTVDFSPDGKWLLSGGFDSYIGIYDSERMKSCGLFRGQTKGVLKCQWNPILPHFVSSSADCSVLLWGL